MKCLIFCSALLMIVVGMEAILPSLGEPLAHQVELFDPTSTRTEQRLTSTGELKARRARQINVDIYGCKYSSEIPDRTRRKVIRSF